MSEGAWTILGIAIGVVLTGLRDAIIAEMRRRADRRNATIRVCVDLRAWIDETLYEMDETQAWHRDDNFEGHPSTFLRPFRFEESLEIASRLKPMVTTTTLELVRAKDAANRSLNFYVREYGDQGSPVHYLKAASQVCSDARSLDRLLAAQIGWPELELSDYNTALLKPFVEVGVDSESDRRDGIPNQIAAA